MARHLPRPLPLVPLDPVSRSRAGTAAPFSASVPAEEGGWDLQSPSWLFRGVSCSESVAEPSRMPTGRQSSDRRNAPVAAAPGGSGRGSRRTAAFQPAPRPQQWGASVGCHPRGPGATELLAGQAPAAGRQQEIESGSTRASRGTWSIRGRPHEEARDQERRGPAMTAWTRCQGSSVLCQRSRPSACAKRNAV